MTGHFDAGVFERNAQFTGAVRAVPEPATYAMPLAGLAALGAFVRRRG